MYWTVGTGFGAGTVHGDGYYRMGTYTGTGTCMVHGWENRTHAMYRTDRNCTMYTGIAAERAAKLPRTHVHSIPVPLPYPCMAPYL